MSSDPSFELDVVVRLLVAALCGALVGVEREVHGHQAGMRTHLLVSLGSAAFTILSIYGFPASLGAGSTDPSRIAAQIVTGIGFLGAGAILKDAATIRGLTTAASLWIVAAIGMAAGAGAWLVAGASTAIAILALWPLHLLTQRLHLVGRHRTRLHFTIADLETLPDVLAVLGSREIRIVGISRTGDSHRIEVDATLSGDRSQQQVLRDLEKSPGIQIESLAQVDDS